MIRVDPKGWIVGAAYTRYDLDLPRDLCGLFWMTALLSALTVAVGTAVALYLFGLVWMWFEPTHGVSIYAMLITFLIAMLGTTWWLVERDGWTRMTDKAISSTTRENLLEAYQGFKDKYCPLVEWVKSGETK